MFLAGADPASEIFIWFTSSPALFSPDEFEKGGFLYGAGQKIVVSGRECAKWGELSPLGMDVVAGR